MCKKFCLYFSCALFLTAMLVLTGSVPAQSADMPSKTLNVAFSFAFGSVDPHSPATTGATNARVLIFEQLIYDHRDGNFSPLLAERWETNEVGDRWRFFLRKDVKFHNGETFDAQDVKATMDRLINNKSKIRYAMTYAKTLMSCEIIDDYTVELVFDGPNPYCLKNTAEIAIFPDEAYAQYGDDLWNKGLMYGTGAWVFKEWVEGQYMHLVKNPDYWNKAEYDSYYEEIFLRIITEPATAVAAHLAGDVQANIPQGGAASEFAPMYATAQDRIERIVRKTSQVFYLTLQCEEGRVFHDKNARMALEYCLNREFLIKNVLDGEAELLTSVIAPMTFGFDPNLPPYEYNPEKAKEFLKQSGYDGRKFMLMSFTGMKKVEDMLLAIRDNMRAVGFNVEIEIDEFPLFAEKRSTGNYDLFYQLSMNPSNDPSEMIALRFTIPGEGHHFDNAEMQDLIGKMMREMDTEKRASHVSRISQIMREEAAPATGIGSVNPVFYCDWGITGFEFYTDGSARMIYVDYDPSLLPKK